MAGFFIQMLFIGAAAFFVFFAASAGARVITADFGPLMHHGFHFLRFAVLVLKFRLVGFHPFLHGAYAFKVYAVFFHAFGNINKALFYSRVF